MLASNQQSADGEVDQAREDRAVFPCGHTRDPFDPVDPDFDVICPKCFGHFFRHAFLPYLLFVALFTTIYFWRPVTLTEMLFAILSLFVAGYVSAVLRRRPGRLFLVLVIFTSISLLVASRMRYKEITETPIGPMATWCLLSLVVVVVASLLRGIANAAVLKDVHKASPLVFLLLVAGLTATVLHVSLHFSVLLVPVLHSYGTFNHILSFVDEIQRYRRDLIVLAGGIALIWSGALSISAAREEKSERKLDHSVLAELKRFLRFAGAVLRRLGTELTMVFIDSLRHFWVMASSAFRSIALIVATWGLAISIHSLAGVISGIWLNELFFLPERTTLPFLALYVLLAWLATWVVIVVALVRHPVNETKGTLSENLTHAVLVLRFNLLRSTPIYWFYLSIVLFVSWFLIGSVRIVYGTWSGFPLGVLFSFYTLIIVLLTTGGALKRVLPRSKHPLETESPNQSPAADG